MWTILAADIGATNCRFALFRAEPGASSGPILTLIRQCWLPSQAYPSFQNAVEALREKGPDGSPPLLPRGAPLPRAAVLAPAGPVQGEVCRLSNVNWFITTADVRESLGIPWVYLINDFAAQAYACLMPEDIDAVPVQQGEAVPGAPVAVIGSGTGFGTALLLTGTPAAPLAVDASRSETLMRFAGATALPCEGGHALFPFIGEEEFALAATAAAREGTQRLIGDHMVTGKGLSHIFAHYTGMDLPPPEATRLAAEHPETLACFARFYARAARNFVLSTLALGGLYITGGMASRIPALTHPAFQQELHDSGPQRQIMEALPVWHVRLPHAGLWGAALYGLLRQIEEKP